jgi:hypothetical protein
MHKLTGLGRPLDFSYLSNRLVAIAAIVSIIAALILGWQSGMAFNPELIWYAIKIGLAVFLSWAIAREAAPENHAAALVATVLISLSLLFLYAKPALLEVALLVSVTRIINRTTGLPPTWPDVVGTGLLALFIAYAGIWFIALALPVALWLNSRFDSANTKFNLAAGFIFLAILGVGFIHLGEVYPGNLSTGYTIATVVIASGYAFYIRKSTLGREKNDLGTDFLDKERVKQSQVVLLLSLALSSLWLGNLGFMQLSVVWAAFSASILSQPFGNEKTGSTI